MYEQMQDDQLEPIYNGSVPIQDIALKTYREQWTMEMDGERGSGKSVLAAPHDDDDDDMYVYISISMRIYMYIFMCIYLRKTVYIYVNICVC